MKIYLSKSNQCSALLFIAIQEMLTNKGHTIVQYEGGQYSTAPMLSSDTVIVLGARQKELYYDTDRMIIGKGQTSEIIKALEHNIQVFVCTNGYVDSLNEVEIMSIDILDLESYDPESYQMTTQITLKAVRQLLIQF